MSSTTSRHHPTARLSVSNFGPIAEAEVDLRPMTVFVGPSNTGKSLLSVLVYALHRWFGDGGSPFHYRSGSSSWSRIAHSHELSSNEVKKLRGSVTTWLRSNSTDTERSDVVPDAVMDLARANLARAELGSYFADEVVRCFGVDRLSQLIRHGRGHSAAFTLRTSLDHMQSKRFEFGVNILRRKFAWRAHIPSDTPVELDNRQMTNHIKGLLAHRTDSRINFMLSDLLHRISAKLADQCVGPFSRSAYYLPADRTGIMHAHRVVVGSLIHRSSHGGIHAEGPLPVLSGVVADFLERLLEMPRSYRRRTRINERLAGRLEESVLDGAIEVHPSDTGYPLFVYRPNGWTRDLPLMNASSMVSELAPVVLFLRYVVHPGDTLIVEEPESHLHPAKQVELTRHLAAAVHAGVRVVLTTHSEWVLEALANLVRLSRLPPVKRKGIDGAQYALSPDQVGAWMFKPKNRPKGSIVEEIKLDIDSGTFPAGYGEITESLYNDWAKIANRIEAANSQ